jgi:hypothetical protein
MAFTTTAMNPRISAMHLDSFQVLQHRVRNGKAPSITVFTSCALCSIQMLSPSIFPQEKPRVLVPMLIP